MPKVTGRRRSEGFTPYWATRDGETARLYLGEARDVLARLPERSVHCVVTSPPYWGLRDYKAGTDELGREPSPQEYVDRMVAVFREVRRVLRDDGTVWLNLGSSYWSGSIVDDADEPVTLRDDLTPDELQYVLSELAASVG